MLGEASPLMIPYKFPCNGESIRILLQIQLNCPVVRCQSITMHEAMEGWRRVYVCKFHWIHILTDLFWWNILIWFWKHYLWLSSTLISQFFDHHSLILLATTYMYIPIHAQGLFLEGLKPVADPGFVKRGGRESKFPARPEKVAQWGGGGLRHIFPPEFFGPTFTLLGRGTVRLPDRPPGWQAKKKIIINK